MTASIGLARTPENRSETVEELLRQADTALYRAKAAGRDCVAIAAITNPETATTGLH